MILLFVGYRSAESALKQDAKIKDPSIKALAGGASGTDLSAFADVPDMNSITNFVLFYNDDEVNNPKAYEHSYSKLSKWVDDSIDIYKLELRRILFPVFVHAFLDLVAKEQKDQGRISG